MHCLTILIYCKENAFLFLFILPEKSEATHVDKRDIQRIGGDKFSTNNRTLRKCTDCFKQHYFFLREDLIHR